MALPLALAMSVSTGTGPIAGILVNISTDIIDWDYLKRLKHAPMGGGTILLAVLVCKNA